MPYFQMNSSFCSDALTMQQLQKVIRHQIPAQYIYTVTEDGNDLINFRVHGVVFISSSVYLFFYPRSKTSAHDL